jgi:VanZ family protein
MHDIRNIIEIGLTKINILRAATIIGAVLLFVGGPDNNSPRSLKALWDLGHIVFFYALISLILLAWPGDKKMGLLRQFAALILISLILSILTELMQTGLHRTTDMVDVGRKLVGTLVAFAFTARPNKMTPTSYLRSAQALSILMVIFNGHFCDCADVLFVVYIPILV